MIRLNSHKKWIAGVHESYDSVIILFDSVLFIEFYESTKIENESEISENKNAKAIFFD
jgi:hypothetical protein